MNQGDWVMHQDVPYSITDALDDGERLVLRALVGFDRKGKPLVTICTPNECQPTTKEVVDIMRN